MLGSFSPLRTTNSHLAYWHRGAVARGRIVVATDEATDVLSSDGDHVAAVPGDRRNLPTLTLIPDGRILAVGGYMSRPANGAVLATCMRFDLDVLTWTDVPSLAKARVHHATVVFEGSVIVIDGSGVIGGEDSGLASVETWTPGSSTWKPLPLLPKPVAHPAAAVLADGSLIVVGEGAWRWDGLRWNELPGAPQRSHVALVALANGGALAAAGGCLRAGRSPGRRDRWYGHTVVGPVRRVHGSRGAQSRRGLESIVRDDGREPAAGPY